MNYVHVVNTYVAGNQEERERMARAAKTWVGMNTRWIGTSDLRRTGRDIGDTRTVPFVRDVIEMGFDRFDGDIVTLTNADSCLVRESRDVLMNRADKVGWSPRLDVDKPMRTQLSRLEAKDRGVAHRGLDLLTMNRDWWKSVRDDYPDMLMGYEGWDAIFVMMLGKEYQIEPPLVYHEIHYAPYWYAHRDALGNVWNRKLARKWLGEHHLLDEAVKIWPGIAKYEVMT